MAQSVKCPTSAQVMISRFVGSSPTSGSVLTAQSLEPAFNSVSPSLSAPPLLSPCLSRSLSKINIFQKQRVFIKKTAAPLKGISLRGWEHQPAPSSRDSHGCLVTTRHNLPRRMGPRFLIRHQLALCHSQA